MLATLTKQIANNARRVAVRQISTTSIINRESGTIKWYNKQKNYGFIAPDEGDTDLFLHVSAFENQDAQDIKFSDGMPCEFDSEDDERGRRARNVTGPGGSDFPTYGYN